MAKWSLQMELRWEPVKPNKYSPPLERARVYSFCYVCCVLLTSVISCMKENNFDVQGDAYVSDVLSCTTLSMPYSTAMTWVKENEVWLLASTVSMETVNTRTVFLFAKCNRVRPSPPPSPQQNVLMWHWLTMQLIYPFLILHIFMCSVLLVSRDALQHLTTSSQRIPWECLTTSPGFREKPHEDWEPSDIIFL